jgi:hypothetical protein
MSEAWLPEWLKEALREPTMDVPVAGKAVFAASRVQSYRLAGRGEMPTIIGGRRHRVPTKWVRQKLLLDEAAS